ncbi:hypothetical protein NOVO_05945 [Rickettsiales bacterium Ac37b]|nr:hypothetical protein NOVO_05945 [Rickettsiales bacterium Ac37b]
MSKLYLLVFVIFFSFFNVTIAVTDNSKNDNTALSDADREQVQNLIHFLNNLPPTVKKEIREYRKYYKELIEESQILYESLSKDAKNALKEEKERKQHLTTAAKKELKKYLKELND